MASSPRTQSGSTRASETQGELETRNSSSYPAKSTAGVNITCHPGSTPSNLAHTQFSAAPSKQSTFFQTQWSSVARGSKPNGRSQDEGEQPPRPMKDVPPGSRPTKSSLPRGVNQPVKSLGQAKTNLSSIPSTSSKNAEISSRPSSSLSSDTYVSSRSTNSSETATPDRLP